VSGFSGSVHSGGEGEDDFFYCFLPSTLRLWVIGFPFLLEKKWLPDAMGWTAVLAALGWLKKTGFWG